MKFKHLVSEMANGFFVFCKLPTGAMPVVITPTGGVCGAAVGLRVCLM